MKIIASAIIFGFVVMALAVYQGLTYEKRTYMESCIKRYEEGLCNDVYNTKVR